MSRFARVAVVILMVALMVQMVSAQEAEVTTHTVRPGDNLISIANFYDTTVEAIMIANQLTNASRLAVGDELIIPEGDATYVPQRTYTVQPGDTLQAIASRNQTTVEAIQLYNVIANPDEIQRGEVINLPPIGGPAETVSTAQVVGVDSGVAIPPPVVRQVVNGRYMVQQGDTLYAIGQSFGVNIFDIARANGILNLNYIWTGQSLIIPGY